jgi:ketosteroid isomerase-like protein
LGFDLRLWNELEESQMRENAVDVAKRFLEVISEDGAPAAITKCTTEDFIWWSTGVGEVQGSMAARWSVIDENLSSGIGIEILSAISEGDRVAIEATSNGVLKNGTVYKNHCHFLFVIRDGRVALVKEYGDTAHLAAVWGPIFERALAAQS